MSNTSLSLVKSYLRSTLRSHAKHKLYAGLNIMGLALGIAACLFILQYVSYERSYDRFHPNHEELYRVIYNVYRGGELQIECAAAVPRVGPFMAEKMPEVVDFARLYPMSGVVTYNNINFREDRIHMTDPSFLRMFNFPLIQGNAETALTRPNTVVVSETVAEKFFGAENPIGKILEVDGNRQLEVTGIARRVPHNSHLKFDLLVSYETLNNETRNEDGSADSETAWGWYDFNTYVQLRTGTDPVAFDKKFQQLLEEERGESFEKYNYKAEFPLQSITDIHLHSNLLQESEPEEQGDGRAVAFLTLIAIFILIIAWINYINLSTARSIERAREVGVRKTLGALPRQLIYQFLTESFILNLISLVVALAIVIFGIGYFNFLTDSSLELSFLRDYRFWLSISGILILGSLVSGLYPAFILSSFRPALVLKGKLVSGHAGNNLRKGLVIFQFAASITLIACTIVVYQQLDHLRKIDLGFDLTETMVVKGPDVFAADSLFESTNTAFKNELLSHASISAISSASNIPGDEIYWTNGIKRVEESEDKFRTIYNIGVDYQYFPTYDINILAGRNYDHEHSMDTAALILNETAIKWLGFLAPEEAIDQRVTFWGRPKTIIGVVDDYNQMSPKSKIAPLAFPLDLRSASFYTLKLDMKGDYAAAFKIVQDQYESFFPGNPFEYFFLDNFFNRQYKSDQKFSRVFMLFAFFAIFVACLGLFGLTSYNAITRQKEIGIRKVLGASVPGIVSLLSREFIWLVLIANLVAWPIIYLVMSRWLDNFANRITLTTPIFLISGLLVVFIAVATMSYKTIQTALSNPVNAIHHE